MAGGGERRRPGRSRSRSAAARDGPLAAFGIVASAGPAWTSAAGGRIDARLRLSFFLPHALEGGAAVDAGGRLIGLVVADPRRRGLVIPAATVARAVAALSAHGYVGRGYLGLALQPLRRGKGGLIAVEVAEGGPAAAAGFVVGDIVTTWEGEALRLDARARPPARARRDRAGRPARRDPGRQPDRARGDDRRAAAAAGQ